MSMMTGVPTYGTMSPPGGVPQIPQGSRTSKLGTIPGVVVPTTLNVLSILMFVRFSSVISSAGLLGTIVLLLISYTINTVTTLSLSAIVTNGTVRGGGAYYLISRSLGASFGGSIGIVFWAGSVLNTAMNAVGLAECLSPIIGKSWEGPAASIVLCVCIAIALGGSAIFARAGGALLLVLIIATLSIPLSVIYPFGGSALFSHATLRQNWLPSAHADWPSLFGLLFPATAGIFAGASLSGDLKNPGRSIPRGTILGLIATAILYGLVVLALAGSASRADLLQEGIVSKISFSPALVLAGEISTSLFSALMGLVGAAKILEAVAADSLIPGLSVFSRPVITVFFSALLAQIAMFADIDTIAISAAMAYLLTFSVTNLACFSLKISGAPNFRPTFKYFSAKSSSIGTVASIAAMIFLDPMAAVVASAVTAALFVLIRKTAEGHDWGTVSQTLAYHQARKYLLQLRSSHVNSWRPQILLLVDAYSHHSHLIKFCNALKKGGLYLLGHVFVTSFDEFEGERVERIKERWLKRIDLAGIKAFPTVSIAPSFEWGVRNLVVGGLGRMRPNLVLMSLPRKCICGGRKGVKAQEYCRVIEDVRGLKTSVGVAANFSTKDFGFKQDGFIDLWLIQRYHVRQAPGKCKSSKATDSGVDANSPAESDFSTHTLLLQLSSLLATVPAWSHHRVRVIVFVQQRQDIVIQRTRVTDLLSRMRISAAVKVVSLEKKRWRTVLNRDPHLEHYQRDDNNIDSPFRTGFSLSSSQRARAEQLGSTGNATKSNPAREPTHRRFFKRTTFFDRAIPSIRAREIGSDEDLAGSHIDMEANDAPDDDIEYDCDTEESSSSSSEDTDEEASSHPVNASVFNSLKPIAQARVVNGLMRQVCHSKITPRSQSATADLKTPPPPLAATSQAPYSYFSHLPFTPFASRIHSRAPSGANTPSEDSDDEGECRCGRNLDTSIEGADLQGRLQASSASSRLNPGNSTGQTGSFFAGAPLVSQTSVIFTTLPPPPTRSSHSDRACREYLSLLRILTKGLPPVVMVHGEEVTVGID